MEDLEDRIAAIPAQTMAGMAVRLWVLWSYQCKNEQHLFTGPEDDALFADKLTWGILHDAERLAGGVG